MFEKIIADLNKFADPLKAKHALRFFKTGKGEYGEGDVFCGATMPEIRSVVKKYYQVADLDTVTKLVQNEVHEVRMLGLLILDYKFPKASLTEQKQYFDFYLTSTKYINNWDLVDVTSRAIVGAYLVDKPRDILYSLAKSDSIWDKRITIISTFYFLAKGDFKDSLKLAELFLVEKHDLMHKAVGWTLREIYKRNPQLIVDFLEKHIKTIPRTALRYSIERMPESQRKEFLNK